MENIHWLGHDGFKLKGERVVYIDPYNISDEEKADIILITHEHYDHCSVRDIMKVATPETTVLITPDCQSKLRDFLGEVVLVEPNKAYSVKGIKVETVPAYNTNKPFHPKENGWVGYVVTLNGKRIYHAGDTDKIPEMADISCDIALLPVSGTYVMTASEAAEAASMINPKVAVPMHYGAIVGSTADAQRFKELCKVPVEILDKE